MKLGKESSIGLSSISLQFKNKKLIVRAKRVGFLGRFRGLMFKSRYSDNLLFEFENGYKSDLHSFFVFFSFLVLWVDGKDRVVDCMFCRPFMTRISTEKGYNRIVELPLNNRNKGIIDFFVGKRKV